MKDNKNLLSDDMLEQVSGGTGEGTSVCKYKVGERVVFTNTIAWPPEHPRPDTLQGTIKVAYDHHPVLSGGIYQHFYDVEYIGWDGVNVAIVPEQLILNSLG